jgi:CRISPR associated protein Cas1
MVGLDPGIGILHADQRARASLALDVMETVRPAVDRYVLNLLAARPFRGSEFGETSSGQCRIMPGLARQLASTTSTWAGEVAPHAELVAKLLGADAGLVTPPTLLTGETRRVARPGGSRTRPHRAPKPAAPTQVCRECGREVAAGQGRCAQCHATSNTSGSATTKQPTTSSDKRPVTIHQHAPTSARASPRLNIGIGRIGVRAPLRGLRAARRSSGASSSHASQEQQPPTSPRPRASPVGTVLRSVMGNAPLTRDTGQRCNLPVCSSNSETADSWPARRTWTCGITGMGRCCGWSERRFGGRTLP